MCAKLRRCVSLHRFGAFLSALSLCFALCVPALADESISGSASFVASWLEPDSSSWYSWVGSDVSTGSSAVIGQNSTSRSSSFGLKSASFPSVFYPADSQTGIYLSFFYSSEQAMTQNHVPVSSDFSFRAFQSDTSSFVSFPVSVSLFSPSSSLSSLSDGVSLSARVSNSLSNPISSLYFYNGSSEGFEPSFYFRTVSGTTRLSYFHINITSFRVVSTASNAELDALESMASNIAAQNQILSQFYGDIVAVCNQIYQRLGDLQAAQEEANALFSQVISLLKTTNGKIEAINMAMSTYFELLINQLKQEGIDTRTAIADAEARLEAYLKPMIDYFNELQEQTGESAATLPGHKTDIDGFNNQGFGIDSDGQTGVAALVPILSAFGWIWSIIALFIGVGLIHILVKKGIG